MQPRPRRSDGAVGALSIPFGVRARLPGHNHLRLFVPVISAPQALPRFWRRDDPLTAGAAIDYELASMLGENALPSLTREGFDTTERLCHLRIAAGFGLASLARSRKRRIIRRGPFVLP